MNAAPPASPRPLSAQLAEVRVGLREDLDVSRHLFRGQPSYVVRDPVSFQCQRLDPGDYHILTTIDPARTLGETFEELVKSGRVQPENEESFYQFVMDLHRLGFLRLPVSDHKILYRRFQLKEQARRRKAATAFLYVQMPVLNPDAFLNRAIRYVRPLFTWAAFVLWTLLVSVALYVAWRNRHDLAAPLEGMLAAKNLAVLWITLVTLKVFHEFGHAFACKHFGGQVPEMGVSLILLTPCAYVDATASWGFPRRRDRLVVALAGMYFETIIAALAVFVWALSEPSLVRSAAYNVMFLAGAVTILFNINPLMRFDGYYILSDLVEVPNLRARSTQYIVACLKRWFLGIEADRAVEGRRLRGILFGFGVAGFLYRMSLLLAIAAVLATKFFLVGVSLAVFYVGQTLATAILRVTAYLWRAEETAHVRARAVALAVLLLVGLPAGLALIPLPSRVRAAGVVAPQHESVLRAGVDAFVEDVHAPDGRIVREGETLARLSNEEVDLAVLTLEMELHRAEVLGDALRIVQPHRAEQEFQRAEGLRSQLDRARRQQASLVITSPHAGTVVQSLQSRDVGRFVSQGEALLTVADGPWLVRAVLSEEEYSAVGPKVGANVAIRTQARPESVLHGEIIKLAPMGQYAVPSPALTQLAGGDIPVDAATGRTPQPYFELTIQLTEAPPGALRHGLAARALLPVAPEPAATKAFRALHRFLNKLLQE